MGRVTFLLATLVAFLSSAVLANGAQDIEKLRNYVHSQTSEHYRRSFGEEAFNESVKINVGRLDSRLRLAECDDNLTFKLQEPPHSSSNITVKVSCNLAQRWTVYVPVKLDIYSDVLVSSRSLNKGDVLTEEDIVKRRVNIASAGQGYIEDITRVLGMELKRPMRPGDLVKLNHLEHPDIVTKGQTVTLTSNSRFLSVETSGVALKDGHIGERIRVRNSRSNRIVEAEIVAPGRAIIAAR